MKRCFLSVLLVVCAPQAMASVEGERAQLSLIQAHLTKLHYLIDRAKQEADYRVTHQFNYDALRADLVDIESGIAVYLSPEREEARPLRPLSGDYTVRGQDE
ncbi:integrative conjugative element protein, RAQPRD family [Vibrio echinoideorum]|uniref:integrative conjugative element protein, RAQPRD family n=1 Tax=Vibrio echinoideorum TaxID=2100116 RepID=UPI00354EE89C